MKPARPAAVVSLAACLALGAVAVARAAEPRTLPAFTVTALDGTATGRQAVVKTGRWLLAYVKPQSAPSRSLLAALEKARGATASGVVVVVGADTTAAKALADEYPELKSAGWYADARGTAFKELRLTGVPVVLALQDDTVRWSLAGVAPDRETLPSVLGSW